MEVRESTRRRRSASGSWSGNRIVVVVPARLPERERADMVSLLVSRLLQTRPLVSSTDTDLAERARALARKYLDGVAFDQVRWVSNQRSRWGSCTPSRREIRISDRLRPVPSWVLDAVLVHELTHLLVANHSPEFRKLSGRYPRMSDADIYLSGFGLGLEQARPRM